MKICTEHKLRKRREGTRLPYACLDCGRQFKAQRGVVVARTAAEEDAYYAQQRARIAPDAPHGDQ